MVEILNNRNREIKEQEKQPACVYLNMNSSIISSERKDFIFNKLKSCGEESMITREIGRALLTKYSEDYSRYLKKKFNIELDEGELLIYDIEFK